MSTLDLIMFTLGTGLVLNPFIARLAKSTPLTPALIYLSGGALLGMSTTLLPSVSLAYNPQNAAFIEHFTEAVVVLTLVSAGLKIDRPFDKSLWASTWRLLGITMVLSIGIITLLGMYWGFPLATALLLGAVLAPTDPVLAHDMQTGPPQQDEGEHPAKVALTTEAGFNDGLAFPFTYLAIAWQNQGNQSETELLWQWFYWDLLSRVGLGIGIGWLAGRLLSWLLFKALKDPHKKNTMSQHFGVFILGTTLLTYAGAELLHGYGFLAVFVAALVTRSQCREHPYHRKMFKFLEQFEESLTSILLLMMGVLVAYQGQQLFQPAYWAFALLLVLGVRPLTGLLGLLGCGRPFKMRLAVAFLGVRGIGSFYYLAYAAPYFDRDALSEISLLVLCTVIVSAILHGISSKKLLAPEKS